MTTRIYLVEDHLMIQRTLTSFIERMAAFEVCGVARSAERALELLPDAAPDLVLIDMSLPRMSGAELVREIRRRWPALLCVLLSGHGEQNYVQQAVAAGAKGYILKGKPAELEPALKQIVAGEFYLSEGLRVP
ncbi:MAG: response regulator [Caldilineaceae bacterium]